MRQSGLARDFCALTSPTSMRRTSPSATRRSSPARRFSHLEFAKRRRRTALVRVFNPTLREHGFASPHTIIEMVNDDMPFLVDSINLALTERALTLHFLAHPIFAVSRDATGTLRAVHEARRAMLRGAKQRLESFQHLEVDRIVDPAALKSLRRRDRAQHARRARGVRRLGTHADRRPQRSRRPECAERALRPDRPERDLRPARRGWKIDISPSSATGSTGCAAARAAKYWSRSRRPVSAFCAAATSRRRTRIARCRPTSDAKAARAT